VIPTPPWLHDAMVTYFDWTSTPVFVYFLMINSSYLMLIVLAAIQFVRDTRRHGLSAREDLIASPLTDPVSVVVAAFNEEVVIVESVRAMLSLRYPRHEVIVVDDGSTDATFERLAEAFDLVQVSRVVPDHVPSVEKATEVWVPVDGRTELLVVRKANSGRSDSLNVGINLAGYPLVAIVDADSILSPEALLLVAQPFVDDPIRTVATGGVIRAVNGSTVISGRVVDARMPKTWVERVQVMEYLRAFLLGRTGWSSLDCLVLISGAFGLFRRDVIVEVGGLDPKCLGEDFELVMRIHRHMRRAKRDYRVTFLAEPVLWTEVPPTHAILGRQRRRWHRGLWQVLTAYRGMTFNPRYGRIGLVMVPYFWAFELVAPVIELTGIVAVPLGILTGTVNMSYVWVFLLVAYAYAILVSVAAVCVEEFTFHTYRRWRDLGLLLAAGVVENLWFRQLTAWWRVRGLVRAIRGGSYEWGSMTRTGFGESSGPALPPLPAPRRPAPVEDSSADDSTVEGGAAEPAAVPGAGTTEAS
jgi:cellulose synthase/poly-beta-1,6-N-acetylglucosamine synthase-like glycosyltransferase